MKIKYFISILICFTFSHVSSQTLDQARNMFTKGEYEKAKPVFKRFVKSQPANASYNYWYGVCCFQTGEVKESIKFLEVASNKKIQNAPLYLARAYDQLYYFDEAVKAYEDYIDHLNKKKQSTEKILPFLAKSKANARMIKGVEEVCIIDSIVTDKNNFLHSYKISEESGTLYSYNDFWGTTKIITGTIYETELKNKIYYSEPAENGELKIIIKNKLLNEWSKGHYLPENINAIGNTNYPYVLTDGVTIYYSSDGENSMGGYDIFVTRYNTGTESYLNPENVGMPFNSPYNDFMYVIDEYNNLGWFASDRNQPEDKVCIYIFIPNTSKQTYNYEAMEPDQIRNLAKINSIQDTWKDEEAVEAAKKRLENAINQKPVEIKKVDFEFIINDKTTYYKLNDFKSPVAKEYFVNYQQIKRDFIIQSEKLHESRKNYNKVTTKDEQDKIAPSIIDLEKRIKQMELEISNMEIKIRNEENKYIN